MNQTFVLKSLRMLQLCANYHLKIPVNLDKFHYTVTEGDIGDRITTDFECSAGGFDDSNFFITLLEDGTAVQVIYVSIMWGIVKEPYILMK